MEKEEIEEYVKKYFYENYKSELVFVIVLIFLIVFITICIVISSWHNSEVDYYNSQLNFCKDIYNSDKVVLEQCKEYFVVLEK